MELFRDGRGTIYTDQDIKNALISVGADECESLFIHSDVMFGAPIGGIKRNEFLGILFKTIEELKVKNIIVPTFTYSFPNGEDYDVINSKTSMGAFNEYIRKMNNRYRTEDPLLSVSVPNDLKRRFDHVSDHSLGEGSALDIIHHMKNVKFLFFGAEMGDCFTYVHYVEKMMDVPYRFDMSFEGNVIGENGEKKARKQTIHTQCYGAVLPSKYDYFENEMEEKGYLKKVKLADRYIACISENDAYREISNHILNNINYFLAQPFVKSQLQNKYTYSVANGRITHC